jgi:hypothetical protein
VVYRILVTQDVSNFPDFVSFLCKIIINLPLYSVISEALFFKHISMHNRVIKITLSKGPNRAGVSLLSPENSHGSSCRNFCFLVI